MIRTRLSPKQNFRKCAAIFDLLPELNGYISSPLYAPPVYSQQSFSLQPRHFGFFKGESLISLQTAKEVVITSARGT